MRIGNEASLRAEACPCGISAWRVAHLADPLGQAHARSPLRLPCWRDFPIEATAISKTCLRVSVPGRTAATRNLASRPQRGDQPMRIGNEASLRAEACPCVISAWRVVHLASPQGQAHARSSLRLPCWRGFRKRSLQYPIRVCACPSRDVPSQSSETAALPHFFSARSFPSQPFYAGQQPVIDLVIPHLSLLVEDHDLGNKDDIVDGESCL